MRNILLLGALTLSLLSLAQAGNLVVVDYYGANNYNKVQTSPSFSWTSMAEPCTSGNAAHGITADTVDQIAYEMVHISENHSNVHLFRNDFSNQEDVVGYPGKTMYSIAYSHELGKLFTVVMPTSSAGATQTLYEVDKVTGALTAIGDLGITGNADGFYFVSSGYATVIGLCYDPISGHLLATTANSRLYSIDPSTGAETLIGSTAAAYSGLAWDYTLDKLFAKTSGGSIREINIATGGTITTVGSADGQLGMTYAPFASTTSISCGTVTPTVCSTTTNAFTTSSCTSYTVPSGDETYDVVGTFTVNDTILNAGGCDSILTITYTIEGPATSSITETACKTYTVSSGDETYTALGTYSVEDTLTSIATGCDSIITINLTIESPDVTVSVSGITLTAATAGVTYQWIDCSDNSPITGATGPSFTPQADGSYAVIISDGPCSDTSACETVAGLNTTEFEEIDVLVYPNPSNGIITVQSNSADPIKVEIIDVSGKVIVLIQAENGNPTIDLSAFEKGMYFLRLQQGESTAIRTITLQ